MNYYCFKMLGTNRIKKISKNCVIQIFVIKFLSVPESQVLVDIRYADVGRFRFETGTLFRGQLTKIVSDDDQEVGLEQVHDEDENQESGSCDVRQLNVLEKGPHVDEEQEDNRYSLYQKNGRHDNIAGIQLSNITITEPFKLRSRNYLPGE